MADGVVPAGEAHIAFNKSDFVLVLPYGVHRQYRLIGIVQKESATQPDNLTFKDVGHDAINGLGITVSNVNWFSTIVFTIASLIGSDAAALFYLEMLLTYTVRPADRG